MSDGKQAILLQALLDGAAQISPYFILKVGDDELLPTAHLEERIALYEIVQNLMGLSEDEIDAFVDDPRQAAEDIADGIRSSL